MKSEKVSSIQIDAATEHLLDSDEKLADIISDIGYCDIRPEVKGFSALARSIMSQQLSKFAAQSIYQRLVSLCGDKDITPESLYNKTEVELRSVGLSRSKVEYLKGLAGLALSGQIDFRDLESMGDESVIQKLTQIKGVGQWTAEMYLMFSMNRLDVFPIDDVAIRNAMTMVYDIPKDDFDAQAQIIAEKWKPYRTIACWYLYRYLDTYRNIRSNKDNTL